MSRWSRFRHCRQPSIRSVRLAADVLGSREIPAYISPGVNVALTAQMQVIAAFANHAPAVTDFRAVIGPNGQVTFVGKVTDDQPVAGYVVRISGTGIDLSATVQSDGTFSVTTTVSGPSDNIVTAEVTDGDGAAGDPAYTTFTPSG